MKNITQLQLQEFATTIKPFPTYVRILRTKKRIMGNKEILISNGKLTLKHKCWLLEGVETLRNTIMYSTVNIENPQGTRIVVNFRGHRELQKF